MEEPERRPPHAPITSTQVLAWLQETAERVRAGEVAAPELITLLGELRRASTAFANASDWTLLAAREAGASLRQIAPVFGKGYVRAPAARLEKLHRQVLNSEQFLELLRRHETGTNAHSQPAPPRPHEET
ncbi:hypothetical protein SAMN05421810_109201 [Amycolatopsis arida]|uniref:Uncharacterized protein n=2 Tax=Amycolatopsis arida TaxID=587909 RepID=A0A1I5ZHB2_9PSEU|nr:hypothetical protein CLV69_109200 [Amycolatopsis arida]SFQ55841.1 hypothetical protein SAMN05421810_109201 [Amycolatopsis arida]